MPSIAISNLGWSTPDGRAVLSGLNLQFRPERTGIVGRNGVGKSTLLHLLIGSIAPASGSITIDGRLAVLRQTVQVAADEEVADLFDARDALALVRKAEMGIASMEEIAEADWTLEGRIEAALAAVGLTIPADTSLVALSGGQRTRAALAGAMFAAPDFLLLDEPTNNLDREGRQAVRDLIAQWRGGAIVVSHDRDLLEAMDAIVELTALGAARYGGGWSAFRARKAEEQAATEAELAGAERRLDAVQRQAQAARERQDRRDARGQAKGARGDMPRIVAGGQKRRAEESRASASRLAARQQDAAANQLATARARVAIVDPLSAGLPSSGLAPSRSVLTLDRVTAGYAGRAPVIRDLSLSMTGPERAAVVGRNGAGKSTLLALIAGALTPWAGTVQVGVPMAMVDQRASLLDPAGSIAANFLARHPGATNNQCRAALARFGFRADAADRIVGTLSGGQMLRAALACVLGAPQPPQLLLLDEPGNHLDIDSLTAIETGLAAFDGALVVVSHDAAFLDAIGITRTIDLDAPATSDA